MNETVEVKSDVSKQETTKRGLSTPSEKKCVNCGAEAHLAARQIIPSGAGGRLVESNSVLVCRRCEMAAQSYRSAAGSDSRRPINFLISRSLYEQLQEGLHAGQGFKSMGSLIRYLVSMYVEDDDRFDDLEQHQDDGSDVKVNIWIDTDLYHTFKKMVGARGLSVTDAIKGLVVMYEIEARPLVSRRTS